MASSQGTIIALATGDTIHCISCAEDTFGDEVVEVVTTTGRQGRFFEALPEGSQKLWGRSCAGCQELFYEGTGAVPSTIFDKGTALNGEHPIAS
jgi:hypothetical protein